MATNSELRVTVGDMSCEHCRETVKSAVEGVSGVGEAEVDLERKLVLVRGLGFSEDDVRGAIVAAGYTPGAE